MTKEELKYLIKTNGMETKCFLDQGNYVQIPNTCGVYRQEMFYYLYIVDELGHVDIIRRNKNPESFYEFCANFLGINKKRENVQTLKMRNSYGRKNKRY